MERSFYTLFGSSTLRDSYILAWPHWDSCGHAPGQPTPSGKAGRRMAAAGADHVRKLDRVSGGQLLRDMTPGNFLTLEEGLSHGEVIVREQGAETTGTEPRRSAAQSVQNLWRAIGEPTGADQSKQAAIAVAGGRTGEWRETGSGDCEGPDCGAGSGAFTAGCVLRGARTVVSRITVQGSEYDRAPKRAGTGGGESEAGRRVGLGDRGNRGTTRGGRTGSSA